MTSDPPRRDAAATEAEGSSRALPGVAAAAGEYRVEADSLGTVDVPIDRLYGVNTVRSSQNFPISGRSLGGCPSLVRSLAMVKQAAALANCDVGALDPAIALAISQAAGQMADGTYNEHLICDLFEGSGGTSLNMNVNEVLANAALRLLGHKPGAYQHVHPNDHVNLSQSTNDILPTAVKLAVFLTAGATVQALDRLADALAVKREAFARILRLGRTCMQDAQPMTLGQAFSGYEAVVRRHSEKLAASCNDLLAVPLGGTAVGTGLGTPLGYRGAVFERLGKLMGYAVVPTDNNFDGMQNMDVCARLSAELRTTANSLWKLGNDLIILSSGPAGGLGELRLPVVQAGSSIMPGKVNPVMPMALCQVALAIYGNDAAVSLAAQQGLLDLNHYEMLIADRLLDSLAMLCGAVDSFTTGCIEGLEADEERCWRHLVNSSALATTFVPMLGYARVSTLVLEAQRADRTFVSYAIEQGYLTEDIVRQALNDAALLPETVHAK